MTLQSRKKPKIYFVFPVNADGQVAQKRTRLITVLQKYGEVFTGIDGQRTPFPLDSDLIVAEVSARSANVWYEIGKLAGQISTGAKPGTDIYRAREIKPILILYRPSDSLNKDTLLRDISKVLGVSIFPYRTIKEAKKIIHEFFKKNGFYHG